MEAPVNKKFEKWVIIPVAVGSKSVTKFDTKLPANVKHCTAVAFTITDIQGCFNPRLMGEITMLFNNRKSHPLNFQVEFKTDRFRLDELLLKLEEPLTGGARVSGYYRNLLCNPHSINMYLQCIAETK